MKESDWDAFLEKLVEETKDAITLFACQHPDEEICYFAYDSEPRYGYVLTCFNTSRFSRLNAKKELDSNTGRLREMFTNPIWFDNAYFHVKSGAVLPFCNNTGDFSFQGFTRIRFEEWKKYADSVDYPASKTHGEDYLLNRVARLFWRAIDRLVAGGSFETLKLAKPTLIGFGFHDDEQYVMQILNLPGEDG